MASRKRITKAERTGHVSSGLTVGEYLRFLGPTIGEQPDAPRWPPDAFALVTALLRRADAYSGVVTRWSPTAAWQKRIKEQGAAWRLSAQNDVRVPDRVQQWWAVVQRARGKLISEVFTDRPLCDALIRLASAADEASRGAGVPDMGKDPDPFEEKAARLLFSRFGEKVGTATLCQEIDPSRVVVLPKRHTPSAGLTIRSLTHYLALWEAGEVEPLWHWLLQDRPIDKELNLLLLPWPEEVSPSDFRPTPGPLKSMPTGYGFFTGSRRAARVDVTMVGRAIEAAEKVSGADIHGIVFPELSLKPGEVAKLCARFNRLVIGGEGQASTKERPGKNTAAVANQVNPEFITGYFQAKHHRWKLNKSQIVQYGLAHRLPPDRNWWEDIDIQQRNLWFFSMDLWLTFCVLICEDLARQEPVAELVRSVGPDLVIALLMDGPQLEGRWPGRYASVLADDPGCSVLTFTSIGMASRSWAPGRTASRVVALWKDVTGRREEIELAPGACGLVLRLAKQRSREVSCDGRVDEHYASYPKLHDVLQVYV